MQANWKLFMFHSICLFTDHFSGRKHLAHMGCFPVGFPAGFPASAPAGFPQSFPTSFSIKSFAAANPRLVGFVKNVEGSSTNDSV